MSKKATEFQRKAMSRMYRGKEIFKPLNTGWTDNLEFAFAHKDKLCSPFKKRVHDPSAPYDAYDESDDHLHGRLPMRLYHLRRSRPVYKGASRIPG